MNFLKVSEQFNKISENRWKLGLFAFTALAFWILLFFTNFKNPTPEQINNLIKNSKKLQKVDSLCENLPKPEGFRFIRKVVSGNSYTTAISHFYYSEIGYNNVEKFYLEWFKQNGWELETERTLDFRKDNLKIILGKGSWEKANYYIYCAEEN